MKKTFALLLLPALLASCGGGQGSSVSVNSSSDSALSSSVQSSSAKANPASIFVQEAAPSSSNEGDIWIHPATQAISLLENGAWTRYYSGFMGALFPLDYVGKGTLASTVVEAAIRTVCTPSLTMGMNYAEIYSYDSRETAYQLMYGEARWSMGKYSLCGITNYESHSLPEETYVWLDAEQKAHLAYEHSGNLTSYLINAKSYLTFAFPAIRAETALFHWLPAFAAATKESAPTPDHPGETMSVAITPVNEFYYDEVRVCLDLSSLYLSSLSFIRDTKQSEKSDERTQACKTFRYSGIGTTQFDIPQEILDFEEKK